MVRPSPFLSTAVSKGQLQVLGQLTDEATDVSFTKTLVKGNDAADAAAAYAKAFAWVDPNAPPAPEPEPPAKTKAAKPAAA